MNADYPPSIATVGQIEPVPRRIRAVLSGEVVLDTTAARYVWEWPHYPQYSSPSATSRAPCSWTRSTRSTRSA